MSFTESELMKEPSCVSHYPTDGAITYLLISCERNARSQLNSR